MFKAINNTSGSWGPYDIRYINNRSALGNRRSTSNFAPENEGFEIRSGSGISLIPGYVIGRGRTLMWMFNTTGSSYAGSITATSGNVQGLVNSTYALTGGHEIITGLNPFNKDGGNPTKWDAGAGLFEVHFYTAGRQLIGTTSLVDGPKAMGRGTRTMGYITCPSPLVKFVLSSSHDTAGYVYSIPCHGTVEGSAVPVQSTTDLGKADSTYGPITASFSDPIF